MTSSYEKIEAIKSKIEASEQKAKQRLVRINMLTLFSVLLAMLYLGYLSTQVSLKQTQLEEKKQELQGTEKDLKTQQEVLDRTRLEFNEVSDLLKDKRAELETIQQQLQENQNQSFQTQEIGQSISDFLAGYTIKIRYTSEFQTVANDIFSTLKDQTTSTNVPPFVVQRSEIQAETMSQWGATGFVLRYDPESEKQVADQIQSIIKQDSEGKYEIRLERSTTASPNFISIFLAQ
ncbi:MAG: hypothetical protein RLZZ435_1451 [Cyanobacteriota bacterium]|jgi:hypothetical protein